MACNATDIPSLSFPRDEIVEIIPASYNNEATRIKIPDLPAETIPASPEDIKIPVPPSGSITPMDLVTPPKSGVNSPKPAAGSPLDGAGTPLEPGDGQHLLVERVMRR